MLRGTAAWHIAPMTWYTIRLDLSRSAQWPEGSADHSYLLRAPLDDAGVIDPFALHNSPERARVLRSWPDQPEQAGYLVSKDKGWVFSYEPGESDDEPIFHLETHPLRAGSYVTVTERDGEQLCFRVSRCDALVEA